MKTLRMSAFVWLSCMLVTIGCVSFVADYILVQDETNDLLDNQLRQIAYYVTDVPQPGAATPTGADDDPEDNFLIQIWNGPAGPARSSDPSVGLPRQGVTGFTQQATADEVWRTYTNVSLARTVQISQRMTLRRELAADAALRASAPIVAVIPLAWPLLGWIVNRVMASLDRVAIAVAARDMDCRTPLPLEGVPREIQPLIEAMNALLLRLTQTLEHQRRFISDAAHELRTPLAALTLQMENLRSVVRGRNAHALLADAEAGVLRISKLVTQLLSLARHEAGNRDAATAEIGLAGVAAAAVAELAPLAESRGARLRLHGDADLALRGNANELRTLLICLIENAVVHMPDGGDVDVVVAPGRRGVALEVRDTGPGIAPDVMDKVFERFFRAASQDVEGTGLGLAIAKSIADRHGLAIELENRAGGRGLVARLVPMRRQRNDEAGAS